MRTTTRLLVLASRSPIRGAPLADWGSFAVMMRVGQSLTLVCSLAVGACVMANPAFDDDRREDADDEFSGDDGDGDGDDADEGHTSGESTGDGDGDPSTGDGDDEPSTGDGDGDPEPQCGDGITDEGEECDLGPDNDDFGKCTSACTLPVCGDGFTQIAAGEDCDLGPSNGDGGPCRADCKINECGDGYLGPGEVCEVDQPDCTQDCTLPSCGNGSLDPGEACDDGNDDNSDECTNACTLAVCGDGHVQAGEECDDGNPHNHDECLTTCKLAKCGDGHIHAGVEECEADNLVGKACTDFDYIFGQLHCKECQFDLSQCQLCLPIGGTCQSTADCCEGGVLTACLNLACVSL